MPPRTRRRSTPTTLSTSPSAPPVFRGDPAISTTILVQSGMPDGVPFSNQGGYNNAELDALIAKAAGDARRRPARTELYKEFQKKVAADLPLINVAEWGFITVARDIGEERLQQSALGGVELGGHVDRRRANDAMSLAGMRRAPPSVLPDISPTGGRLAAAALPRHRDGETCVGQSPPVGEMSGRTERSTHAARHLA